MCKGLKKTAGDRALGVSRAQGPKLGARRRSGGRRAGQRRGRREQLQGRPSAGRTFEAGNPAMIRESPDLHWAAARGRVGRTIRRQLPSRDRQSRGPQQGSEREKGRANAAVSAKPKPAAPRSPEAEALPAGAGSTRKAQKLSPKKPRIPYRTRRPGPPKVKERGRKMRPTQAQPRARRIAAPLRPRTPRRVGRSTPHTLRVKASGRSGAPEPLD